MSTPTDERTVFVIGQVHALLSFAYALAQCHADKARLRDIFDTASQGGLTHLENAIIDDKALAGFQDAATRLRRALA
jgi:hypothetical protein